MSDDKTHQIPRKENPYIISQLPDNIKDVKGHFKKNNVMYIVCTYEDSKNVKNTTIHLRCCYK